MKIITISDSHGKHNEIPKEWLEPADMIIHAGDVSSRGYDQEMESFFIWFNSLDQYKYKIFIAGNHDFYFQDYPKLSNNNVETFYKNIIYLQDKLVTIEGINIYGSPWQPRFYNWAFNLDRGDEIAKKWSLIPQKTDILITHGPAYGYLDQVYGQGEHLGCQDLYDKILEVQPKVHICGHIHSGYGIIKPNNTILPNTTFINASLLNEQYLMAYKPITFEI